MPKSKKNLKHKIGGDPQADAVKPAEEAVKPAEAATKPAEAAATKPAEAAATKPAEAAATKPADAVNPQKPFSYLNPLTWFKATGGRRHKKTASKNKKMMGGKSRKNKK